MGFNNGNDGGEVSQEFDLNDPSLFDGGPGDDWDPEGELVNKVPRPPSDGEHVAFIRLSPRALETEAGAVQLKHGKRGPMVMAVVEARVANDEGEPGAFLKESYINSLVFEGQVTSQLAAMLKYLGKPFSRGMTWAQMADHVKKVFEETPEEGFRIKVKTRWIKSVVVVDPDTGDPVLGPDGKKTYLETKGEKKVTAQALAAAAMKASEMDEDEREAVVEFARQNPHLYEDHDGEQRSVKAEIVNFVRAA